MGKWLTAYREGQWKPEVQSSPPPAQERKSIEWRSKQFGTCMGRLHMVSEDGWVLIESALMPDTLVWVREDLLCA